MLRHLPHTSTSSTHNIFTEQCNIMYIFKKKTLAETLLLQPTKETPFIFGIYDMIIPYIENLTIELQTYYSDLLIEYCKNEIIHYSILINLSVAHEQKFLLLCIFEKYEYILDDLLKRYKPSVVFQRLNDLLNTPITTDKKTLKKQQQLFNSQISQYNLLLVAETNQYHLLLQQFQLEHTLLLSPIIEPSDKLIAFINNIKPITEFDIEICNIIKKYITNNKLDDWHENLTDYNIVNIQLT